MTVMRASAPGKVVVCGEYAVLDGATAIVMAIDRRARVRLSRHDAGWHRLTAPGFDERPCEFYIDDTGKAAPREATCAAVDLSLLSSVWKTVRPAATGSLQVELDTRPFFHPGSTEKLGLGSSAALVVALTAALLQLTGDPRDAAGLAFAAHRELQGGYGSGADVAAATRGGVVAYRTLSVEALSWPEGLHRALLWSGRPASTAARIARLRSPARSRAARTSAARLARAAEGAAAAWRQGEIPAILEALAVYTTELRAFSVDRDLGIFDAGHDDLFALAAGSRLVYKPCGAGGGDVGMVFSASESPLMDFVDQAARRGFEWLDVALETRGVEVCRGRFR